MKSENVPTDRWDKICMHGGRTIVRLHGDGVPTVAASLINQERTRDGMLAITCCERAEKMARLKHNVSRLDGGACGGEITNPRAL